MKAAGASAGALTAAALGLIVAPIVMALTQLTHLTRNVLEWHTPERTRFLPVVAMGWSCAVCLTLALLTGQSVPLALFSGILTALASSRLYSWATLRSDAGV